MNENEKYLIDNHELTEESTASVPYATPAKLTARKEKYSVKDNLKTYVFTIPGVVLLVICLVVFVYGLQLLISYPVSFVSVLMLFSLPVFLYKSLTYQRGK